MWRQSTRVLDKPPPSAAATQSRLRAEGDVDPVRAHADDEDEGDDQHEEGEGEDHVHDPHDRSVQPASEIAADSADEDPETEGEDDR